MSGASDRHGCGKVAIAVSLLVLLSLGSAACYVLATLVIKRWDAIGNIQALVFVTAALAGAVFLETEALRRARLGYVFIVILGFEASLALLGVRTRTV